MENLETLLKEFQKYKDMNLSLNMARGKPSKEQLDLSLDMLDVLNSKSDFISKDGVDVRNYGDLTGIIEAKEFFSDVLKINKENIVVYGNSMVNVIYDFISRSMTHGVNGSTPWCKLNKLKWLCPVPGYDRHFAICEYFGIEMINIPMDQNGPDMDLIEEYIKDESVKGIFCVPIYSNPTGITYSDEVVRRFARLKPAAKDFRIYWDEAYIVHHLYGKKNDEVLNLFDELKKAKNENLAYIFISTNKMGFAGSGVVALATGQENIEFIKDQLKIQTISFDKVNQLRQARFFVDAKHLNEHMKKHAEILRPKFELINKCFNENLREFATFTEPNGGYFVSLFTKNVAKEVVERCKSCGLILTDAGAAYPYHNDPDNSHIRIAPSYISLSELETAMKILVLAVKIETLSKK